jgi:hypothetical protein
MNIFIGEEAQGMQDLGMAERFVTQAAKDYEEQYGIGAKITMDANH